VGTEIADLQWLVCFIDSFKSYDKIRSLQKLEYRQNIRFCGNYRTDVFLEKKQRNTKFKEDETSIVKSTSNFTLAD